MSRLLPLFFEVVLLSVAIYQTVTYWATFKDLSSYKLIAILLRDQVLYFLMCVLRPSLSRSLWSRQPLTRPSPLLLITCNAA